MGKETTETKAPDTAPPAAAPPEAPSVIIPDSTAGTRSRGRYFHHAGAGLVGRDVDVLKRYKAQKHDADGNPYTADVVDLAYPGADEPFVTACAIADRPGDGAFIPA